METPPRSPLTLLAESPLSFFKGDKPAVRLLALLIMQTRYIAALGAFLIGHHLGWY